MRVLLRYPRFGLFVVDLAMMFRISPVEDAHDLTGSILLLMELQPLLA